MVDIFLGKRNSTFTLVERERKSRSHEARVLTTDFV